MASLQEFGFLPLFHQTLEEFEPPHCASKKGPPFHEKDGHSLSEYQVNDQVLAYQNPDSSTPWGDCCVLKIWPRLEFVA